MRDCLLCGAGCQAALCPACLTDLPAHPAACELLGGEAGEVGAEAGHVGTPALALWRYVSPADRVVLGFKYGGHGGVARLWASLVAERLPPVDALVAMPMHPARLAERGENPAMTMALALRAKLPDRPPLVSATKTRLTARQQGLDRHGRLANVAGAYRIDADLRGRHVLLVDDVLTTGASFIALATAARTAGAAAVTAVAMARATA